MYPPLLIRDPNSYFSELTDFQFSIFELYKQKNCQSIMINDLDIEYFRRVNINLLLNMTWQNSRKPLQKFEKPKGKYLKKMRYHHISGSSITVSRF